MNYRRFFYILILLLLLTGAFFAGAQEVYIRYYENYSKNLRIVSPDGSKEIYASEFIGDDTIGIGWTVVTENGDFVELQVEPNGTIIRISENTNFRIDGLQGMDGAKSSDFSLVIGKFRAVAGKATGKEAYNFYTDTTVCGVRGTDFGAMKIINATSGAIEEQSFVFEGVIDYTLKSSGKTIAVNAGEFAKAAADSFQPQKMSPQMQQALLKELGFDSLDPAQVPNIKKTQSSEPAPVIAEPITEETPPPAETPQWLQKLFNFEIGSIVIDGNIFAKAVLQPTVTFGSFELALYLPIIYRDNLFDGDNWYKPKGNNEWSFGTDQGNDTAQIFYDVFRDLFLKIKYLKYGEQRDLFYIKIGNFSDFTVGHGSIMWNYANDLEFPAVRRVGLNMGVNTPAFGFEAVVNDLADPEIMGGRLYFKPLPIFAIGLTTILDINPFGDGYDGLTVDQAKDLFGDPILFNIGIDVEFPIIDTEATRLVLFVDLALLVPYFRSTTTLLPNIQQGFAWDTVFLSDPFALQNFGIMAGGFGNAGPVTWRGEFRYYNGMFRPTVFNSLYDINRAALAVSIASYANDPHLVEEQNLSFYGEIGYTMENVFSITGGYGLPFSIGDSGFKVEELDYFKLQFGIDKGLIPFFDIGLTFVYERNYFYSWLLYQETEGGAPLGFFDMFSVFKTVVDYSFSRNVDILFIFSTTAARDSAGNLIYNSSSEVKTVTTFSIQTLVHF